ncbi:hypothetical protein EDD36DRAFT_84511 [Exophiala viscosa]|uniref:Xylanolytic transcriptional activator regulatory domain-containing protein n=1 Tax=Exophiala viscosa TaxID=2486360 RepID=A0AAN6DP55_9EURO|nr:hypothetical protein EDD36DRAFT_84511 [Exophiala viscosa]
MNSFNMHLPIFHIPTFDLASNPSPLILAMCAIGALLLLDRPNAGLLYSLSRKALRYKHQRAELELPSVFWDWSRPCEEEVPPAWSPLWDTQTDLLLTYFGAFCGDPEAVVRTMEEIGSLSCTYRLRQAELGPSSLTAKPTTWNSWAERECTKRLLCGIFIISSLLTITYGICPGFSVFQHGDLEMPGEQSLWDASTEVEWLERKRNLEQDDAPAVTLRLAVRWALDGQSPDSLEHTRCSRWSPFMATVTMHGVNTLVYHVADFTHPQDVSPDTHPLHGTPKSHVVSHMEDALGRCYDMIVSARNGSSSVSGDAKSPLLFNSLALLRVCYIRAFTNINSMDRNILLRRSRSEMLEAIRQYAVKPVPRSALLARVVAHVPWKPSRSPLEQGLCCYKRPLR